MAYLYCLAKKVLDNFHEKARQVFSQNEIRVGKNNNYFSFWE